MAKLYGIGMGPGDPELISVKALNLLRDCEIIAYPAPPEKPSFVRQIAAHWLDEMPPKKEIIISIPLEGDATKISPALENYEIGADKIMMQLNNNHDVAVLCEGDPFLYGSFIYLFRALSKKIEQQNAPHEIHVIPGISSVMTASAHCQNPLAEKAEPLLILPALKIDEAFKTHLQQFPAIALMKIGSRFGKVKALLEQCDLLHHAFYIEYASLKQEKIVPLAQMDGDHVPYFSMILIRKPRAS